MNNRPEDPAWNDPARSAGRASQRATPRDDLLAPRTQIVTDRDAYLGQSRHDIGRRISDDQVELFITADVAGSLQREFATHTAEFITLHDLGASASLRLLSSLAGAAGSRVQRLSVRRQGHGVALAVLQFVEMPLEDGTPVRIYATDINADAHTRSAVARVMLAHSRLGVLLVGEVPPHALAGQLGPLHESLMRGAWPNRELLMVPLGSGTALAAHAAQLATGSAVSVHVTPHADKPRQAWGYIGGAWNRLNGGTGPRSLPTDMAQAVPRRRVPRTEAPTQPMGLSAPMPAPTPAPNPAPAAMPASVSPPAFGAPRMPMPKAVGSGWQTYAERCLLIKGAVASCVFDVHTAQSLAFAGGPPSPDRLAQQGTVLLGQMNDATRALGLGTGHAEASLTASGHHIILRPVPGHPGVALHLVLHAGTGNLTLARMQLDRIEPPQ